MRRQLLLFTFLLLAISVAQAQELTVCTYNLRYKNSSDTDAGNGWNTRRTYLINLVNFQQPDLLGVQEAYKAQMDDMQNGLTGYAYIGVGRDNGTTGGEYSAIFYRKERMELLDHGDFWLSDTPWKASKGFPSQGGSTSYNRICSWGKFYDKAAGVIVYHFNTHLDLDETNRQQSYYLIKQKIQEIVNSSITSVTSKDAVIISGDYNAVQSGGTYKLFKDSGFLIDSWEKTKQKFITNGTCPGFNANNYSLDSGEPRRIDHIFVTKRAFDIMRYGVLNSCYYSTSGTATYHERAYSDHSPVFAKLSYKSAVSTIDLATTLPPLVNGVYQISTPQELEAFSYIVNGMVGFTQNLSAKAVLLNDIDMTKRGTWLPIGTSSKPYTGTFDGQGHSIQNIAVKTNKSCSGLFGKTSGATIKNLRVSGIISVGVGTTDHGAVGYADATAITDVHSALNITTNNECDETRHIGGIAGTIAANTTISRCSYSGTLSDAGTNTIGGIVGYADGTTNSISYAINSGTVKTVGASTFAGGILGYVNYDGFQMSYCANVGTVTGSATHAGQVMGRQVLAMTTPPSNLYFLSGASLSAFGSGTNEASATGATAISANDAARGELTYLLNNGQSTGNLVFFQNLDEGEQTDPYPVLYPGHKVVHQGILGKQKTPSDNTNYYFYVNEDGRLATLEPVNYFSTPVAFTADYACYTGESTATWGTLYLPFATTSSDNLQLYEVMPEQTEADVLAIAPCHTLAAYTPGFYQILGGAFELEAYNATIAVPPASASLAAGNFLLTGTLDKHTAQGGYAFNGTSFQLQRPTDNVVTNAFNAYLTAEGEQPQEVTIFIWDATGIQTMDNGQWTMNNGQSIYDLSGRKINGQLPKGIYIINGKKYIK